MTTGFRAGQGSPDYFGLVDQVTSMVTAVVPPSKTVLVVSKGDENLLRLGSRTGWHFPRTDDGRYAGHYPADSDDAIGQLEALRERGAGYVVFPATSLWWLDHYPELGRHLDRYTCLVRDEDTCAIFDLTQAPAADGGAQATATVANPAAAPAARPTDRATVQLAAFLDNLLPAHAKVGVAVSGDEAAPDLRGETARFSGGSDLAERLAALREQGFEFLVVPRGARLTRDHPGFLAELDQRHRCIARQRYLCSVYDLAHVRADRREHPASAWKTGVWQRLLRFIRRGES